ncbi:MAG: peptidylprolyl isomerase [Thermoguttaceae bacterium]
MKRAVFTAAGIVAVLAASLVLGQEASEQPPAAVPAATAAETPDAAATETPGAGPKTRAFHDLFTQWKKILEELRQLKYDEYPQAGVDRRVEISKRYQELITQGEGMQPRLVAAAVETLEESPNADPAIVQFLAGILTWDTQGDDYEKAIELGRILIEAGVTEPHVYAMAGEAAFCTNDFDLAEKYFKLAEDGGAFDAKKIPPPLEETMQRIKVHQGQIGYYKAQWTKEKALREAEAKADDLPRVEITTQHGKMIVELLENEAPNTVANFISLVKKGFYDGLTFHRVLPNFMAQGGDPDGTGGGGPGYRIECECVRPDSRKHFRGSLSMAHAGPDTGGSQFFLCFVPAIGLDGPPSPSHHTVFGRVVEGLDQLAKIRRRDPESESPGDAEKILSMKVLRDRGHEYTPKTLPDMK